MTPGVERSHVRQIERGETVSEAVVQAVADATGRTPTPSDEDIVAELAELDELFDTVDPDALDALFRGRSGGRVVFYWSGCEITVENESRIVVTPLNTEE